MTWRLLTRGFCNWATSPSRPTRAVQLFSNHVVSSKPSSTSAQLPPVIMLHGVVGSESTYRSIVTRHDFVPHRDKLSVDLRNHGKSPHVHEPMEMTYDDMVGDVLALLDSLEIPSACIIGHSMGGKVAMHLALTAPDRVSELIVVDIAPISYIPRADAADPSIVLGAMAKVDLNVLDERSAIDAELERNGVTALPVRQFAMTNLVTNSNGGKSKYRWRLNVDALAASLPNIMGFPPANGLTFTGPTCAIRGGKSPYVPFNAMRDFTKLFPNTKLVTISDAGHWLQAQMPDEFVRSVNDFLDD